MCGILRQLSATGSISGTLLVAETKIRTCRHPSRASALSQACNYKTITTHTTHRERANGLRLLLRGRHVIHFAHILAGAASNQKCYLQRGLAGKAMPSRARRRSGQRARLREERATTSLHKRAFTNNPSADDFGPLQGTAAQSKPKRGWTWPLF